jgi:iron complex outermembrane receptor protein
MYSPKWNGSLGATYTFPLAGGEASASAQYTYTAKKWGNYTQSPSERLPSVSLVNAAVSWSPANANWSISAWGRNLFDKRYVAMALDVPPLFTEGVLGNPRQFGIDFDFKF